MDTEKKRMKVTITGGGGYVGSALVPYLIEKGYDVTVLDLFWFGEDVFRGIKNRTRLRKVRGDIRNPSHLREAFVGADAVIHLACISNDPSFELDSKLGKSINYDSFELIMHAIRRCEVKRFIYASSSSVYGVKPGVSVTESSNCMPLTDYSRFKLACENDLRREGLGDTEWVVARPATVCGYADRLRLDLTVNILTISALAKRKITVHGGDQLRPNLNIKDMVRAYELLLSAPKEKIHKNVFNIGFENHSVIDIARMVLSVVNDHAVEIVVEPTKDHRSYHVNSEKIFRELGFKPQSDIRDAISSLVSAFRKGKMDRPLINPAYYNIKQMQLLSLGSAG